MKNDRYIVEQEFEHAGYKCVVTFNVMGHRCGYVGIPKNHPLYGKEYSDYLEIKKADVGDRKISGGLGLTVHIAMTQKNLDSLMRDFLITESTLLCRLSVKTDFALMAR